MARDARGSEAYNRSGPPTPRCSTEPLPEFDTFQYRALTDQIEGRAIRVLPLQDPRAARTPA